MKVWVDDIYFETNEESTIFQFCSSRNINLPCFCYHEKLTIAGNCRICLVEANNALVVSCAMPLLDNMRIFTNSKRVRKARESVMEFLLVNHPLDCPICDQGGECDLQDISLTFGSDRGRFYEYNKRSVDNLYCCGPLVKTVMTRCIHCTRCVRFITEISGAFDFGVLGRGNSMEIGTYIERFIFDELSANIIDLCPVGALTSMPYAFSARPWELSNFEGIDIFDSLASSISVGVANNKIMRIVPVLDENINEEWITNKARFAFDSLSVQRLNYPKLRLNNKLIVLSWPSAFDLFLFFISSKPLTTVECLIGHFSDLETVISLKDFFNGFGCSNLAYEDANILLTDFRFQFLLNTTIVSLESASMVLLIGTNLRVETPLLNSRLRKNYLAANKQLPAFSVGLSVDYLTFPVKNLGNSILSFKNLFEGRSILLKSLLFKDFVNTHFINSKLFFNLSPKILLGVSLLNRLDANSIFNSLSFFLYKTFKASSVKNYLNIVSPFLGKISSSEIGISSTNAMVSSSKNLSFSYFCGVNNLNKTFDKKSFLIYQGIFKSNNFLFARANLIFPTTSFLERNSTYLNIEGKLRTTKKIIIPFKFIFSDWDITKGLSIHKKKKFPHNFSLLKNFYSLNFFKSLIHYKSLSVLDTNYLSDRLFTLSAVSNNTISNSAVFNSSTLSYFSVSFSDNLFYNSIINRTINNYYSSDIFSKNSKVMSLCAIKVIASNFSN